MMTLSSEPAWLLPWAFLSAVAEAPFWSASKPRSRTAGPELTTWANSLLNASKLAGIAVGPALGGALLAVTTPGVVFGVNAVSFVVSGAIIVSVHARFKAEPGEDEFHGLRAGFRFLRHDRVLRTLLFAWVVFISGMGMSMVADAPLAAAFDAGSFGFGLRSPPGAAGPPSARSSRRTCGKGARGPGSDHRRRHRGDRHRRRGLAVVPLGRGMLFVMGLADGMTIVAETNLRQRRAPDAVRSRVSAAFTGVMHLMLAFAYMGLPSSSRGSGRRPHTRSVASPPASRSSSCSG